MSSEEKPKRPTEGDFQELDYVKRLGVQGNYEFSFEPKSIWIYEKNHFLEKICDTEYKKEQFESGKKDWVKAGHSGYLSGWNKEYHKRIIEYWSREDDIILDPFAGHSSSFMPYLMNRKFKGFEITKKRFNIQINHCDVLKEKFDKKHNVEIFNNSSEFMDEYIEDKTVDCIITDPPFWNLEKYEEPVNGTQLSHLNKKDEFDLKFKEILSLSMKKLKPGKFAIIKIANFRRSGILLNLKDEWTKFIEAMGMDFVDEIILELSPVKRHPLYPQAINNLNALKVHEYLLVFRKPIDDEKKILINNEINYNRPFVRDLYDNDERLFWAEKRGKKDWITEQLKDEFKKYENSLENSDEFNCLF